jgi:hypothetical protein
LHKSPTPHEYFHFKPVSDNSLGDGFEMKIFTYAKTGGTLEVPIGGRIEAPADNNISLIRKSWPPSCENWPKKAKAGRSLVTHGCAKRCKC